MTTEEVKDVIKSIQMTRIQAPPKLFDSKSLTMTLTFTDATILVWTKIIPTHFKKFARSLIKDEDDLAKVLEEMESTGVHPGDGDTFWARYDRNKRILMMLKSLIIAGAMTRLRKLQVMPSAIPCIGRREVTITRAKDWIRKNMETNKLQRILEKSKETYEIIRRLSTKSSSRYAKPQVVNGIHDSIYQKYQTWTSVQTQMR